MVTGSRPQDAGLRTLRLPLGAYASILHRVTGLLLLMVIASGLVLLRLSLRDPQHFATVGAWILAPTGRALGSMAVWVAAQHLYGGIRHMLLDTGRGWGRTRSRQSAAGVLILALVTAVLAGLLWP